MSCSNKGVQLKGVTREGPHTSNLFPCVCSLWLWLTFHEASLQYYYYYYYQLILFLSISLNIATHICGCLSVMLLTALRSTQMSICGLMRLGICGSGSLHSSHLRFGLILWYAIFLLLLCLILTHASSSMCTIPYSSSECSDIICSSTAIYFGAILRWGSQVNKINVGMQSYVRQNGCSVSQWLRVGGVKAFADGSLGSRTALFHEVLIIFCTHFQLLN